MTRSHFPFGLPTSSYSRELLDLMQLTMALDYVCRGFADFNMPAPFAARVKNALNAEARSVRLSNLVGAGGLWYGFGRSIAKLCVLCTHNYPMSYGGVQT
jgi:hypothetical protein